MMKSEKSYSSILMCFFLRANDPISNQLVNTNAKLGPVHNEIFTAAFILLAHFECCSQLRYNL